MFCICKTAETGSRKFCCDDSKIIRDFKANHDCGSFERRRGTIRDFKKEKSGLRRFFLYLHRPERDLIFLADAEVSGDGKNLFAIVGRKCRKHHSPASFVARSQNRLHCPKKGVRWIYAHDRKKTAAASGIQRAVARPGPHKEIIKKRRHNRAALLPALREPVRDACSKNPRHPQPP